MIRTDSLPTHRDSVRPVDSYSLAVDPYRAPRHRDSSASAARIMADPVLRDAFTLETAAGVA